MWRRPASPPKPTQSERIARETADFLLAELATSEGGFASALDADSANEKGDVDEGTFYVWNPDQLIDVLGADDGPWAADVLCGHARGNVRAWVLDAAAPG